MKLIYPEEFTFAIPYFEYEPRRSGEKITIKTNNNLLIDTKSYEWICIEIHTEDNNTARSTIEHFHIGKNT